MAGQTEKDWNNAKAQAQKVLGKTAELPKARTDIVVAMNDANKVLLEIVKIRDQLQGKIDQAENAMSKVSNAAQQYSDMIDGSDFKLDPKKPDDRKKIAQAQKLLDDELKTIAGFAGRMSDALAKLDKSLASLEKDLDSAR